MIGADDAALRPAAALHQPGAPVAAGVDHGPGHAVVAPDDHDGGACARQRQVVAGFGDVGRQAGQQGSAGEERRPLPLEVLGRRVVGRRLAVDGRGQLVGPRLVQGQEPPDEPDVVVAVHRLSGRRR